MKLKSITLFLAFAITIQTINEKEISEEEARKIAREESQRALESLAWAQRMVNPGNNQVHTHIHNAANSASNSNPTSSATIIEQKKEEAKEIKKKDDYSFLKSIDIKKFLTTHKAHIGGGILFASYIYIFNRIYQINKLLANSSSWHAFKEEIPMTRLTSINRNELFKELKLAICKKYINLSGCDNDQTIMLKFLTDIKHEKSTLETYITYQTIIDKYYLSKIFPTFKKIDYVQESVARLNFLMDLYIDFFILKNQIK